MAITVACPLVRYDSKGRSERRRAIRSAMSDYELSLNTGCLVCFGQKRLREYQPFTADPRFEHLGDEGDVYDQVVLPYGACPRGRTAAGGG